MQTTSPNRSSPAGSNRLPVRSSMFGRPFKTSVEAGKVERTFIEVGGNHAFRMAGGQQCLETATRADIERLDDRATDREMRQRDRRALNARNVIGGPPGPGLYPVGDEQQVVVRDQAHARADEIAGKLDQSEGFQPLRRDRRERLAARRRSRAGSSSANSDAIVPSAPCPASRRRCTGRSPRGVLPGRSSPSAPRSFSPR